MIYIPYTITHMIYYSVLQYNDRRVVTVHLGCNSSITVGQSAIVMIVNLSFSLSCGDVFHADNVTCTKYFDK